MTRIQFVMSLAAIAVAIANPWLLAVWNRKHAQKKPGISPMKGSANITGTANLVGFAADFAVLLFAFANLTLFMVSPLPMSRLEVAFAAIFAAVIFSTLRNITSRLT